MHNTYGISYGVTQGSLVQRKILTGTPRLSLLSLSCTGANVCWLRLWQLLWQFSLVSVCFSPSKSIPEHWGFCYWMAV